MSIIAAAATNTDQKGSNHSDTSSDEADRRRGTERPANAAAVGRSYECTFCKRGFTNAQALGGHMNIHRKDKLKAKQKSNNNIPQKQQGSSLPSSYLVQIPTDQQRFYPSPRAQHVGYLFYPSSYKQQVVINNPNDDALKAESLGVHGDLMGANLTLRIGPQREEDDDDGGESKKKEELLEENEEEEEVDLELRLGHHKYS